jgi:hypothetical protein
MEHADTVVWLDLPLRTCLRRLWRRTIPRIRTQEVLWNGNTESWRAAFVGWESLFVFAIRKHVAQRRALPELLARPELAHVRLVRLRTPAAVEAWAATVADAGEPPR